MSLLLQDPDFSAMLDGVIAKHRHGLTPRQIRIFREQMARTFETNPRARAILARDRPDLVRRLVN